MRVWQNIDRSRHEVSPQLVAVYTRPESRSLRIYLAEDSPIMMGLLSTLLGGEPTLRIVGQGKSAEEAVRDIETLKPDIVVTDLVLESGTGYEILEAIAARDAASRPIVVVLTNYVTEQYREKALGLGADYFFDKCGDIVRMLATMTEIAGIKLARNGSDD
jgi:DNA-binding NarL/FixJ family response regulator